MSSPRPEALAGVDAAACGRIAADLPDPPSPAVRFYGRRRADGPTPLIVHFHGGAFNSGSLDSGGKVGALLAAAGAVVLSVDYPLAPEHPFPAAAEAGHAVLEWAHRHRRLLGGRGSPLFVAGEEAGGNIAAATALMARDRGGPELAGQILLSPMLDACMGTASMRDAHASPQATHWADGWKQYLPCYCDASHPYAAPLVNTRLAGLAPMLLLTARDDPLRDEVAHYARRARQAGVRVTQAVVAGARDWPAALAGAAGAPAAWDDEVLAQVFTFLITHPPGTASAARPSPASATTRSGAARG
ncbi:alpha/beta hydrolase [Achromobacter aloeverae]|uniref:Alpha/beta hydrolase n=1 Tax=Achromobacter aloeverae TaxID=1750518 RepID=A0A4Q1HJH6_9BURK|nr:alpha/beta hydrolase [Achromobacter aloeverae]RXN90089.1 alpha/beta hydrolase [Achromobacter aloeverae]